MIVDAAKRGLRRAGALWGLVALPARRQPGHRRRPGRAPGADAAATTSRTNAAADNMLSGFDYPWWSARVRRAPGQTTFGPDILGAGFAFKNLDLLLRGRLPAGAVRVARSGAGTDESGRGVDPTVLALGAAYLVLQVFLSGGVIAALRAPQPRVDACAACSTAAGSTSGASCAWPC